MEQAFVEQVTKLVLAKLEQVLNSELRTDFSASLPTLCPLSQQEVERWNEISQSIHAFHKGGFSAEAPSMHRPLSQEEIKRWDEISSSINKTNRCSSGGGGFVKIYQYG